MGKLRKDLTGQTFGRLHVETSVAAKGRARWNCICVCGNRTIVRGYSLQNGDTKSCGCLGDESRKMARFIDLTNKVFGRLTVLSMATSSKAGRTRWQCKCSCGNSTVIQGTNLANGHTTSCGCVHTEVMCNSRMDLTGQTFGRLTAIKQDAHSKNGHVKWLCKCTCGKISAVIAKSLRAGLSTSCGCYRTEELVKRNLLRPGYVSNSATTFLNRIEQQFGITIDREFPLEGKYFDGRYKNYLIEVDSIYFHSSPKQKANDNLKNKIALNNGYTLIRCLVNNAKEVDSALLKNASSLTPLTT